jgi:hypothetical protein
MKYFFILLAVLIISAGYIYLRDDPDGEYFSPKVRFHDEKTEARDLSAEPKKKGGIIIFDIPGLTFDELSDPSITPFLSDLVQRSRVYSRTANLSPDRIISQKSFFECVPPYKSDDKKEPYSGFKALISKELRNISLPDVFRASGNSVKYFCPDSSSIFTVRDYFPDSMITSGTKETLIQNLYKSIMNEPEGKYFYYADLGEGCGGDYYLRDIDFLLGRFNERLKERYALEPVIVLISTGSKTNYGRNLTVFNGQSADVFIDSLDVSITDMAKSLLIMSKQKYPPYFAGYDVENDEEAYREYFAGSSGDTLLLFDSDIVYKKLKYSEDYYLYDLKNRQDVTKSNIGINEKFHDLIPSYFGGDYIKYIIVKNNSEKQAVFRIELRSIRRFSPIEGLFDYYTRTKKGSRYDSTFSYDLEPGGKDTLLIYYSALHQDFSYSFNEKYAVSYGGSGINAGEVKSFEENSYYGMKYSDENLDMFADWDVRIFNLRVNY